MVLVSLADLTCPVLSLLSSWWEYRWVTGSRSPPSIYVGPGDPNLSPHVYITRTLTIELSQAPMTDVVEVHHLHLYSQNLRQEGPELKANRDDIATKPVFLESVFSIESEVLENAAVRVSPRATPAAFCLCGLCPTPTPTPQLIDLQFLWVSS